MLEGKKKLEWKIKSQDSLFCFEIFEESKLSLILFSDKRIVSFTLFRLLF